MENFRNNEAYGSLGIYMCQGSSKKQNSLQMLQMNTAR